MKHSWENKVNLLTKRYCLKNLRSVESIVRKEK